MALSLGSYDARGGENLIGPVGTGVASALASAFGVAAWLVPIETALATSRLFTGRRHELGLVTLASTLVVVFIGCALTHLALPTTQVYGGHLAGGVIGEVLGEVMRALLGLAGAFVVGIAVLLVTLVLRTEISVFELVRRAVELVRRVASRVHAFASDVVAAWREAKEIERREREALRAALEPRIVREGVEPGAPEPTGALPTAESRPTEPKAAAATGTLVLRNATLTSTDDTDDASADEDAYDQDADDAAYDDASLEEASDEQALEDADEEAVDDADEDEEALDEVAYDSDADTLETPRAMAAGMAAMAGTSANAAPKRREPTAAPRRGNAPSAGATAPEPMARIGGAAVGSNPREGAPGPRIVPPQVEEQKRKAELPPPSLAARSGFVLPPTTLLEKSADTGVKVDESALRDMAKRLGEKLADYGVKGRVDEIHPGPVVTMFEFEPAPGTKLNKIAALADDLAMVLAVEKVRIVAPIPGKARVGFELPNKHRKMVYLRDVLEDEAWHKLKGGLPIAVGQDIAGHSVCYDLAKMPHLLVAGATGQGKSVGLNVMLTSLLCRKTPDEVRMIMIDPKMVELKPYAGIPHLLLPVVTDMNKAALALKWAVDEMERRYQLFADSGSKNILTYNERVEKVLTGQMSPAQLFPERAGKVRAQGPAGEAMFLPADDERSDAFDTPPEKLPYIVVVIDEFADLMMVAAKDVEACVARLAQKARAAGIHVILATQRPSVDVITGMIKANFPTRMAFRVTQREDSRTILGSMGAEHLLGLGDMLVLPPGSSDLKRAHSAYVSEEEVEALCDHLRAQGKPVYDERILAPRDDDGGDDASGSSSDDPMYDRAVACVSPAGFCSISQIQRALGVGYNKAAKLVEQMEREGVVGPASAKAGGRREVLVGRV